MIFIIIIYLISFLILSMSIILFFELNPKIKDLLREGIYRFCMMLYKSIENVFKTIGQIIVVIILLPFLLVYGYFYFINRFIIKNILKLRKVLSKN